MSKLNADLNRNKFCKPKGGAGRPLTLTNPNPGPKCSTYDSAKLPGLSTVEDSAQFLSPVSVEEHSDRGFTRNTPSRTQKTRLASPGRRNAVTNISEDSSFYFFKSPTERSGRPINHFIDAAGNRIARAQRQQYLQKLAQEESRLDLEYEMAKNKEIALQRLREDRHLPACDARPHAQIVSAARRTKQDLLIAAQRQQNQGKPPNSCVKAVTCQLNAVRGTDADKVYNYNKATCRAAGTEGHPINYEKDLTYRRLNLPTPKEQRARSCPTPVQHETPCSSMQRVPQVYQRPAPTIRTCPPRSSSVSAERYCETLEHSIPTAAVRHKVESPKKPVSPSGSPQVCQTIPTGTITTTTTTTTTAKHAQLEPTPSSPFPQKLRQSLPHRSPERVFGPQNGRTPLHESQNISNKTKDYSVQLDSSYGRTTPSDNSQPQQAFKTPGRIVDITDQFTTTPVAVSPTSTNPYNAQRETPGRQESVITIEDDTLTEKEMFPLPSTSQGMDPNSETLKEMERVLRSIDQRKTSTKSKPPPREDSHHHNASMLDESSHYRKKPKETPANCYEYIDLTDETQYDGDDMDISNQVLHKSAGSPRRSEDNRRMQSWAIPPEDLTCIDRSHTSQQETHESWGGEPDSTQYLELPTSFRAQAYSQPQICQPCGQPKASIFRCLASKLTSAYNVLSSLVAPERPEESFQQPIMDQTAGEIFETAPFNTPVFCSTNRFQDDAFHLRKLYEAQRNEAANFITNTALRNKTQLVDEPASVKECATAKRCGHVQFDSSDKGELPDPHRSAARKAEIENLVKDTYCPGVIQETVDGREDFNDYYESMSSEAITDDPMTLLEAFSLRIEKERTEIMKGLEKDSTEQQTAESIKQHFAKQYPTDLNRSIEGLLLSEHLHDLEQVAESKGISFEAEVQNWITDLPDGTGRKLISYTGRTRPREDKEN